MHAIHRDLLDALQATPDILAGLIDGLSQDQARAAKGGDENWSVVEVICHLRDAEEINVARIAAMRDQDNPAILSYDQNLLARERNYHEAELRQAFAAFLAQRQAMIAMLSELTIEQWERPGQHNQLGRVTIFSQTLHRAAHDAVHCAQIARQLMGKK